MPNAIVRASLLAIALVLALPQTAYAAPHANDLRTGWLIRSEQAHAAEADPRLAASRAATAAQHPAAGAQLALVMLVVSATVATALLARLALRPRRRRQRAVATARSR